MIIVEGPDNVGKSTLVANLAKILGQRGHNMLPMHLSKLPRTWRIVDSYASIMSRNIIFDRFHISRDAYGSVFKEQIVFNEIQRDMMQAHIDVNDGFVVKLFCQDGDWIRRTWSEREQMYDVDGIMDVNRYFRDDRNWRCDIAHAVDRDGFVDAENIANRYMAHIQHRRQHASQMG